MQHGSEQRLLDRLLGPATMNVKLVEVSRSGWGAAQQLE
jgi:hypothetical protein